MNRLVISALAAAARLVDLPALAGALVRATARLKCVLDMQDADFAIARCGTPEAAQALLVRADDDGYVEFGTDDDKLKAKVSLVTGDDETEFWDRRSKSQAGKRERDDDAGHGTSKRGRGGRGRGRGRGGRAFRGRRGSS